MKLRRPRFVTPAAILAAWVAGVPFLVQANDNWPQWRGPTGNGISDSTKLPTEWSLEHSKNIVWKAELPSWSGSTPVIWGDHIFITSPSKADSTASQAQPQPKGPPPFPNGGFKGKGDGGFKGKGGEFKGKEGKGFGPGGIGGGFGRSNRDPGGQTLLLVCMSKKDGSIRWQRELDEGNQVYNKGNSTSPSPVTDGKLVWVVTGNGVVTALDFDGKVLWKRNLQNDYGRFGLNWGYGSSPLLFDGKLIIEVLHGMRTDDASYLVAFDGLTGNVVWRKERPTDAQRESPDAYTTPALLIVDGKPQIVVLGGDYVTGHDPASGDEIWRAGGLNPYKEGNYRTIASPLIANQMIYASAPQKRMPVLALRAGGKGDVSESHLAWRWDVVGVPDVPTPVSDGKYLYLIGDGGLATCLDAKTGKPFWEKQRLNVGATISASPLLADGKIYVTGENAVTVVLAAGPELKPLATNELDGSYTLSSIAVSGQQLFVRTSTHLYCIGNKAPN